MRPSIRMSIETYDDMDGILMNLINEYRVAVQPIIDVLEEWNKPQWDTLYFCTQCYANCVANDYGRMMSHELCIDGSEDHDWEMEAYRPEE